MDDTADVLDRFKLDVEAYHKLADAGVLGPDDRVELIEGELIRMAPIGAGHGATVDMLNRRLVMACGDRAVVSPQNPISLDRFSEPQPDFAISRPRADARIRHPGPADLLLVVEVADTTLRADRAVKLPLYARAGVPEVWIVDLGNRVLESYRVPVDDGYTEMRAYGPGDTVALSLDPEIRITLDGVLG